MPHVYAPGGWEEASIALDDRAIHHLRRVLRLGDGSRVTYTDGAGRVGAGSLEGDGVVRGDERDVARPVPHVTLAVAPPRVADRARMVVEKLAELGVDRLVWLETERGEGRPPRPERSDAWARAALEQSKGAWLMEVRSGGRPSGPWPEGTLLATCTRDGEPVWPLRATDQPVLGLVGPEGGFLPGEAPDRATEVSLGTRVLRVETAAVAFAVLIRAPGA